MYTWCALSDRGTDDLVLYGSDGRTPKSRFDKTLNFARQMKVLVKTANIEFSKSYFSNCRSGDRL